MTSIEVTISAFACNGIKQESPYSTIWSPDHIKFKLKNNVYLNIVKKKIV